MYYHKVKKSRKHYTCFNCNKLIEKGTEYGTITAFPHEIDWMLGSWPVKAQHCIKCFNYYKNFKEKNK